MALVLADADGVRERLEGLRAPSEYCAFSQRLAAATEEAVQAALAAGAADATNGPAEVLELDGARALLLVPGAFALEAASRLARNVEARFWLPAGGIPGQPIAIIRRAAPAAGPTARPPRLP